MAGKCGNFDTVKYLVDKKADVNHQDFFGVSEWD